MTYHVFIFAGSNMNYLFALTEEELTKIIEAHDTGADHISIPGEMRVDLKNFHQIKVYQSLGHTKEQAITFMRHDSGKPYQDQWRSEALGKLGPEVTKEKLKYGFGEKPRPGGLAPIVSSSVGQGLWDLLHPRLSEVSRKLYEDGSFKESAQAAFTEIDARVREKYRVVHDDGKTGAPMMFKAFAKNDPVIQLFADGVDDQVMKQEGYMHIFVGVMMAIRNPKSHSNFGIEEQDAIELLFLASRLLRKLDEAVK